MMNILKYIKSIFVNAEDEIKREHLVKIHELRENIVDAKYDNDIYNSTLKFLMATRGKISFVIQILDSFEKVNYGQHDEIITTTKDVIAKLDHINTISNISPSKKGSLPPTLCNMEVGIIDFLNPRNLYALKYEDANIWIGNLENRKNSHGLKKFVDENFECLNSKLSEIFSYITKVTQ